MVASPTRLGPEYDCIGKGQTTGPSSRQRDRPPSANTQLSDSNKNMVVKPQMGALFQDRLAE
jgi:hypothetical protein